MFYSTILTACLLALAVAQTPSYNMTYTPTSTSISTTTSYSDSAINTGSPNDFLSFTNPPTPYTSCAPLNVSSTSVSCAPISTVTITLQEGDPTCGEVLTIDSCGCTTMDSLWCISPAFAVSSVSALSITTAAPAVSTTTMVTSPFTHSDEDNLSATFVPGVAQDLALSTTSYSIISQILYTHDAETALSIPSPTLTLAADQSGHTGFLVNGASLVSVTALGGETLSIGSAGIIAPSTTLAIKASALPAQQPAPTTAVVVNVGSATMTLVTNSQGSTELLVSGTPVPVAIINGTPVSIGSSALVVGGKTLSLQATVGVGAAIMSGFGGTSVTVQTTVLSSPSGTSTPFQTGDASSLKSQRWLVLSMTFIAFYFL